MSRHPDSSVASTDSTISYATPVSGPSSRTGAGAAILFGGIALIVLGGCFLIGILSMVKPGFAFNGPSPTSMTLPEIGLMCVLYLMAFACFAGGAFLIVIAIRGLLKVMRL